jgi:hypothetical protein
MDRTPEQEKEQAAPQDRRLSAIPSRQKMALLNKALVTARSRPAKLIGPDRSSSERQLEDISADVEI